MRNFIFIAMIAAIISGCNKQTNYAGKPPGKPLPANRGDLADRMAGSPARKLHR